MKKELYWIRGSDDGNDEGVRRALQKVGIITDEAGCENSDLIYFGCKGEISGFVLKNCIDGEIIMACGTELQPLPEEKEEEGDEIDKLRPFDRVVVRISNFLQGPSRWEGNIFLGKYKDEDNRYVILSGGMIALCNENHISTSSYVEVHKYEPYMDRYIGTTTPFCDWKKE